MARKAKTNLEKAMKKIHEAQGLIREAIKEGKEVDGHLEDVQTSLTKAMDVIDLVDLENKGQGDKMLENIKVE